MDSTPTRSKSKASGIETLMPAAIAAVSDCTVLAQGEASELQAVLPSLPVSAALRKLVNSWSAKLEQESVGALAVLQELQAAAESGALNAAEVVHVLTEIDARTMDALSQLADLVGACEKEAEAEPRCEPVYVRLVEMTARLMRAFERAQVTIRSLRDAMPRRDKLGRLIPNRVAADGSAVVLEVGAEGGSLTLIGREDPESGAWRFARVTNDQSEALFGELRDQPIQAPDLSKIAWVDGWEAGLKLLDRYPWARLYPLYVHPGFVEQVRAAVKEQLEEGGPLDSYKAEKWESVLGAAA
jgi:hypothetical protein